MSICQNCGREYQNGMTACPFCGAPAMLQQPVNPQQQMYVPPQVPVQKPKKKKGCLIVLAAVAVIFGIGVFGASKNQSKDQGQVTIGTSTGDASAASAESAGGSDSSSDFSYQVTDTGFHYYTNSIGSVEYYGYVEITNTGSSNIYLSKCTFDLEDNDGHLLQTDSMISTCPDIIAPGEKGYFYNSIGSTRIDKSVSLDNGVKLVPSYTVEKARGEIVDYEVSDTEMRTEENGKVKVTGRVANQTDEDDGYLYIQAIFYDAEGKVAAITGTSVTELTAGSKQSFDITTAFTDDNANAENVKSFNIIARKSHYQF